MFGATFLVPVLTRFPPTTTLLFSGIGTIVFLIITGNRLPSYLGSSFSVIAPVTAAVASNGTGSALGGLIAVGLLLIVIGTVVHLVGTLAFFRGIIGRLAIFGAVVIGYLLALVLGEVDTAAIAAAPWLGLPQFQTPTFSVAVLPLFLPAVIALIAENIGHVKSVGQTTGTDMDPLIGRA